ncbi:hypothetical protein SERLA73DRAFT_174147 [Serpula lacrymans var. lacrymans S7.3]|uniref:Seipin n=2 Tax=Serpula lacrymans var. lacrymans TaxID=341189 RepID=F8PID6_SERL3|nr:uncharacterized protein SERLADRAFT_455231 [Serpula lacrymans var. lacrymans S7.9]EGO05179.1 hypothetical protein SERLA73DRAFT_174147 [Serpula lacrymans var. lacrymans S7.3]EGO30919.1 hypothetical protein SERLADRAFT_455231 [Serpula lacrymans var. lacrymans S7.9]
MASSPGLGLKLESETKALLQESESNDGSTTSNVLSFILWPFRILFSMLSIFRPFAPQIIPLVVCLVLIPVILIFSLYSGYYVWKNVAVGWESPIHLQYGDGVPPYAEILLPYLSAQQPYDISLHLEVPATESNFALGNFMTTLTLSTPTNRTLTSIRRPYIALPPSSGYIPFFSSPARLVDMDIPLLLSYVTGVSRVIAKIELGRRDGWKSIGTGEGRELSVVSASLRGIVRRHGIRGLVTRFPLISAFVSFLTFLAISLLVLVACLLPAIQWRFEGDSNVTEPGKIYPGEMARKKVGRSDSSESKPFRSRRRSRGNVSGSRSPTRKLEPKTEDVPAEFPLAASASDPIIRRRRSRTSEEFFDSET